MLHDRGRHLSCPCRSDAPRRPRASRRARDERLRAEGGLRDFAAGDFAAPRRPARRRPGEGTPPGAARLLSHRSRRPLASGRLDRPLPHLLAEADREAETSAEGNGAMTHETEPDDATESIVVECDLA